MNDDHVDAFFWGGLIIACFFIIINIPVVLQGPINEWSNRKAVEAQTIYEPAVYRENQLDSCQQEIIDLRASMIPQPRPMPPANLQAGLDRERLYYND
jgi:hypothetical protein